MPRTTDRRPAARVFEVIATPERWSEGYLETRLRSPDYPRPESRNDRGYRTRIRENAAARVISCEPSRLLEEAQRNGPSPAPCATGWSRPATAPASPSTTRSASSA
jgi:hypothetical protein